MVLRRLASRARAPLQKNMTEAVEAAKNNYALVIKLDLTFLALVSIF